MGLPYIFGIDYKPISNLAINEFKITNCDRWFFTDFTDDASPETRKFVGRNDGKQWQSLDVSGNLLSFENMMQSSCPMVERQVPYFKDFKEVMKNEYNNSHSDIDSFLLDCLDHLTTADFNANDRNFDQSEWNIKMPDGVYEFSEASPESLRYKWRVNDANHW